MVAQRGFYYCPYLRNVLCLLFHWAKYVINKQCSEHCQLKVNNSTWHDMTWCDITKLRPLATVAPRGALSVAQHHYTERKFTFSNDANICKNSLNLHVKRQICHFEELSRRRFVLLIIETYLEPLVSNLRDKGRFENTVLKFSIKQFKEHVLYIFLDNTICAVIFFKNYYSKLIYFHCSGGSK